ncbi:glutamate--cysteine ligase [Streptomyces sp. NPDC058812]|uniref:carboxylate-amine ligase n=1 Tax=unclassified Streptomyces TaxID=2593676 RepID=UPI003675A418
MDSQNTADLPESATLGVEEEFLLIDRSTLRPVGRSSPVVEESRHRLGGGYLVQELSQAMVETVSCVCDGSSALYQELVRLRREAARAADTRGCLLLASGTSPDGSAGPALGTEPSCVPGLRDQPRYARIRQQFGPLLEDQAVCACHVHVGVPDVQTAVQVINHLRPWLPLLLALTANSPFWRGRDTGYESWRAMVWSRWPTAGPPPWLRSAGHYEAIVRSLVASGAALDPAMIYWFARPSRHVPTVEVRIADVLPTVEETVAYALLVRALVAHARSEMERHVPAPQVQQEVLIAACWRAARTGVSGHLPDLCGTAAGTEPPAAWHISALRAAISPHLVQDDERTMVDQWLDLLMREGSGAERQRAVHRRTGSVRGLIEHVALTDGEPPLTAPAPALRTESRCPDPEET